MDMTKEGARDLSMNHDNEKAMQNTLEETQPSNQLIPAHIGHTVIKKRLHTKTQNEGEHKHVKRTEPVVFGCQ